MLSKILKVNQIFIPFLLYIISGSILLIHFFNENIYSNRWISLLLLLLTMGIISIYVNFVSFFKGTKYFYFFLLFFIALIPLDFNDVAFFSAFIFLTVSLLQILDERTMNEKLLSPFDIGFFTAVSVLLYPPFWIFMFFLILYYIALSKIQIRGLLLSLLGILTLVLLCIEISILFNISLIPKYFIENITFKIPSSFDANYLWLSPIFIFTIISFIDYLKYSNHHVTEKKIVYFNTIITFISVTLYLICYGGKSLNGVLLFAFPISMLLTNYAIYTKLLYKEIVLWLFLFSLIIFRYSSFIQLPEILKNLTF